MAGKFGVRGGGYSMSNSASWNIERTWLTDAESGARAVNMNHVGRELLTPSGPPIEALFVYNCNPAVTLPDQARVLEGLARDDVFTVVFDQVLTDTALYADVVLPATTFLEHDDFYTASGHTFFQVAKKVVEFPPEVMAKLAELQKAQDGIPRPKEAGRAVGLAKG